MKVLAVGDIHTKTWIIDEVIKKIEDYDKIVFVGDYADDWSANANDSIATWKSLYEFQLSYPEKVVILLGNHDFIYLKHIHEYQSGFNDNTKMLMAIPENEYLERWLSELPYLSKIDNVTYSHAGLTDYWYAKFGTVNNYIYNSPSTLWRNDSPLWARPSEFQSHYSGKQVFGHTPSETCWEVQPNVWCIDTFSTHPDGSQYGDHTVLEITDGKTFNKIKLEKQNARDNNSSPSIS